MCLVDRKVKKEDEVKAKQKNEKQQKKMEI